MTDTLKLTVGADNVFDEYPDALPPTLNTTNNTPFTRPPRSAIPAASSTLA